MRLTLALLLAAGCSLGLSGCFGRQEDPVALASLPQPVVAEAGPEQTGLDRPEPSQIVAVRGGDIMIATPSEQAARKRQLAALRKEIEATDPSKLDKVAH